MERIYNMNQLSILKSKALKLPKRPGVYMFKSSSGKVLYVGKAISLYDRVTSYFSDRVLPKTRLLVNEASGINYIETGSEITALLLEANLIKKYLPQYNIILRDDKSYIYVYISTKEEFPKILVTRKNSEKDISGEYFGPYTSAKSIRAVMKWLRRIFPYCQQGKIGGRACFYSHLGLCDPCPSDISKMPLEEYKSAKRIYRKNIFAIKKILEGKIDTVTRQLLRDMKQSSDILDYENAVKSREQLRLLESLKNSPEISVFLENSNYYLDSQNEKVNELITYLKPYYPNINNLNKIESYDISTIQGNFSSGSQVVFINGLPEKKYYRRYRIKNNGKPNDIAMMTEVLSRRFKHHEWKFPDLIVIDGGKPQITASMVVLTQQQIQIPVLGLAKRLEEIIIKKNKEFITLSLTLRSPALQLLQQIRDEAHRFAVKYHRLQRDKFLTKGL